MSLSANGSLEITTDGNTLGVSCPVAGFVLITARFNTAVDLDWSGFTAPPSYEYIPNVFLPWGGNPLVLDESQNLFTAYTSNVTAPQGSIILFTGVALPPSHEFTDASTPGAKAIELYAESLNIGGTPSSDIIVDTIYVLSTAANIPPEIDGGDIDAVSVEENQTAVSTVEATDDDGDEMTFTISGGADASRFTIESDSGVLSFSSPPNYENPGDSNSDKVFEVEVTVTDARNGTDSQLISVTITDVNDNPVIISDGGGVAANIEVYSGQESVTTILATDDDGDDISYWLNGGDDEGTFWLYSDTGVLIFRPIPDYDTPTDSNGDNVYVVEISADDGIGDADIQTIYVTVVELTGVPVIKSDGGGDTANVTVDEDQTAVTTVEASDSDGDDITFSISGGLDSAFFSIDSVSGDLAFISAPDYEDPNDSDADNIYIVEVTATDKDGTDSQTINVTVADINDSISIISDGGGDVANVSADENQLLVTTVEADEKDGDPITYSISGGDDSSFFAIGSSSGDLTFVTAPDYEDPNDSDGDNIYVVEVTATEKDGSDSQIINVSVENVNDGPEIISNGGGDTATLSAFENQIGVTTVQATTHNGKSVTYGISGGTDSSFFTIDSDSGVLTLLAAPDYENPIDNNMDGEYIVEVSASSQDGIDTQILNVSVFNVNELPEITSGNGDTASVTVEENQSIALGITAFDVDGDMLTYIIYGGADAPLFTVSSSGEVSFLDEPDFEAPSDSDGNNIYVVEIAVLDVYGEADYQTISVSVSDNNDPADIVNNGGGATANVYIEERIAEITDVVAIDEDGDDITYSIVGGVDASFFLISGTGGLYFINAPEYLEPMDSDANNSYIVEVRASDTSGGYDEQAITVYIGDAIEPEDAVELDLQVHKKSDGLGEISYSGRLEIGRVISVFANPASGYRVKSWTGTDGKEATNEQLVTLTKNDHKVVVQFEEVPAQKITKATFKAGKTRRDHDDSFDIRGVLGAGANHIAETGGSIDVIIQDVDGNTLLSNTLEYDDEEVKVNWPKSITFKDKDKTIIQGDLESFKYNLNSGKFQLTSKRQDMTGWVSPLSLTIDFGGYSAYLLLYDQGANDVINGKKHMPRQFLSGSVATLTVDDKKYNEDKEGNQSGKLIGRFSTSYSPLDYTLTTTEILIGSYRQVLLVDKHNKKDIYTYKRSKDADLEVQFIEKATFDFDKAQFNISFKNASFDVELETLGVTFGWEE